MRFDVLLFDLDGTLIDSHHEICLSVDLALRDVGLSIEGARVAQLVDGSPLERIWQTILQEDLKGAHSFDETGFTRFVAAYRSHYMRDIGYATATFPEVHDTLLRIRAHRPPVRCAVVSNKSELSITPLLERFGLAPFFEHALGCGDSSVRPKPEPDLLLRAAALFDCEPTRCAMIGDTILDVIAGKRAGMTTFALSHGMGEHAALVAAGADHVVTSFSALSSVLFTD